MDLLTTEQLQVLFEKRPAPCVSIYLPTHRAGREIRQDPIRLKNLLREAEGRLVESGHRGAEARQLLEAAQRLLPNEHFWRHQDHGLAIFLSQDFSQHYRLPLNFPELAIVTDRFHVKPLLPLFTGNGRFYILGISQNQVKLLEGTRFTVTELDLETVPKSLSEALRYDDPEKQHQFRTLAMAGAGSRGHAIFHGHTAGVEDVKENLFRYFRQIDKGLKETLKDRDVHMVLAGVDYLLPIYREANSYAGLLEEGVTGNPEGLSAEELHKAAWRAVEPHFIRERQEAADRYLESLPAGKASSDLREVLPAACSGRVDSLFVAVGVQEWGVFDPEQHQVEVHEEAWPGDEDLLNLAAIHTILSRGTVHAVPPAEMPGGANAAATFRY